MSFFAQLDDAIQRAARNAEDSTRAERVTLRVGVIVSAALLLSALIALVRSGAPNYAPTLTQLVDSLSAGDARSRLHLGLLLLCLSPLLRLILLAGIYARRHQWDLVLTVWVVIAAVALSFFLGLH